jgi:SAM-dependent methyltransferase
MEDRVGDVWKLAGAYSAYIGRWSAMVAREFLRWLDVPGGARWLDVGCGPGTLVEAILRDAAPRTVVGIDRSQGLVEHARTHLTDPRARFEVGDALALPARDGVFEAVVSGLVLNFVRTPSRMISEMVRAGRAGSTVALYVWDYAEGMELTRTFWNAARALDPGAVTVDEAERFPICAPEPLAMAFSAAGLEAVATRAIEVPTQFRDFDDYWSPFLGGQGPAPAYAMSLVEERRVALREKLRATLPAASDGSISLRARAWAVRGFKPAG